MGAGAKAVMNEKVLQDQVGKIGQHLGLKVAYNSRAGKTIWGTLRKIDVLLTLTDRNDMPLKRLGIECISQEGGGTAKYKVVAKHEDMKHWPVDNVLVYGGDGFGDKVEAVMDYMGSVPVEDLEQHLRYYFGLKGVGGNPEP